MDKKKTPKKKAAERKLTEQQVLDACEAFLSDLLSLLKDGNYETAVAEYYRIKGKRAAEAVKLLERNAKGHARILHAILASRRSHPDMWGLWPKGDVRAWAREFEDPEYPDEGGTTVKHNEGKFTARLFGDSVVRKRQRKKPPEKFRENAEKLGLSPWLLKEISRLRGSWDQALERGAEGLKALLQVEWTAGWDLHSKDVEEGDVWGLDLRKPADAYVPEGLRKVGVELWGVADDGHYYALRAAEDLGETDPLVLFLDHEEEDESPGVLTYASIFLSGLKRKRVPANKRG